jgi:lipopolysaccharide/colanic/teichoic acid biosynthesis glycosyltransferase
LAAISSARRPPAESASSMRPRPWVPRLLLTLGLMGCDALAINVACVGVYAWGLSNSADLQKQFSISLPSTAHIFWLLLNLIFVITFVTSGMYTLKRGISRVDEAFKVAVAISLGLFIAYIVNALLPVLFSNNLDDLPLEQQILALSWAVAIIATITLRVLYRGFRYTLRRHGIDTQRVLIVGARDPGRLVYSTIRRVPQLGYRVQGFLSDSVPVGDLVDDLPVLGNPSALGRVIRATRADEVIIALSGRSSNDVLDIVGVKNVALDNPLNRGLKRTLDMIVAVLVLTFGSPMMLLIAALIRLDSRGPVFFAQERVGLDGKPFPTIKFRTMRVNAPDLGNWTTKDDPRVTRLGGFLRRYSLDELPQFMNVLRGEMSVVGPRPEQPIWVEHFSQSIPRYVRRHKQKAGITGWAQVNGLRGDTSIEERTRYDLYYVENWSLLFDIKIIIKTGIAIFKGDNQGY